MFSSNKLIKLKYIHHFFSKISKEKVMMRLMGREIPYFARFAFGNYEEFGQGMNFCYRSDFSTISFNFLLGKSV